WIRYGVREPQRWRIETSGMGSVDAGDLARAAAPDFAATRASRPRPHEPSLVAPLAELFAPALRRRTILNCIYVFISIIGLWAGSVYVPAAVTHLATQAGLGAAAAARLASLATMLLSVATVIGCVLTPPLAERWGRRG